MSPIFQIISFTRSFWKWYVFMGVFVVTISLLGLISPLLSKQVVDLIVAQLQGQPKEVSQFFVLLGCMIGADIAITVFTAVGQWIGDILAVRLQTYLSRAFYEHLLSLDIGFYDNEITGNLTNKMYRGIQSITDFITNMLNNFLPFFLTAFVTIIILAQYSGLIALLLAILFPIYIIISHSSTLAWGKFEQQKNEIADQSQGRAFESLSGIRVVKAFAAEIAELAAYVGAREKIEKLAITQTKGWHKYDFYRRISLNIILFAIYSYIVYWTFHQKFTIGEMTLLLQLVNQARFPLFAMSFILGQIQQASAGSKDFFALMAMPKGVVDQKNAHDLHIGKLAETPMIEFQNVAFSYEAGKQVLNDISFCVPAKKTLALVGESGQGKSTMVNLLLRYYDAQAGKILVGGESIGDVTQRSLRQQMAVVFQESLLFSGTILENIRYGNPQASNSQVEAVSLAANAHEFIQNLPGGYEAVIGERGVKLSGGQKQRISIARAMLKDAPIIILDEATSALDSKSELLVQQGLDRLTHNRTSIIIAHRLSTVAKADYVLVLSGGSIGEWGTPKELLARKHGLYADLIKLQRQLLTLPSGERTERLKRFDLVG